MVWIKFYERTATKNYSAFREEIKICEKIDESIERLNDLSWSYYDSLEVYRHHINKRHCMIHSSIATWEAHDLCLDTEEVKRAEESSSFPSPWLTLIFSLALPATKQEAERFYQNRELLLNRPSLLRLGVILWAEFLSRGQSIGKWLLLVVLFRVQLVLLDPFPTCSSLSKVILTRKRWWCGILPQECDEHTVQTVAFLHTELISKKFVDLLATNIMSSTCLLAS